MRSLSWFLWLLLPVALLSGCKNNNANGTDPMPTAQTQTQLLVGSLNGWQLDKLTDTSGKTINASQVNLTTQVLFGLIFQFKDNNTVRALDRTTKQIVNGGEWTLTTDNKAVTVNVTGFKGDFPLVELTAKKMTLRQVVPVNGTNQDVNLEFIPSL
jgi:hypothetical protein